MGSVGTSNEDRFIRDMVREATSVIPVDSAGGINPNDLMSNSDMQAIVEAYVLQYGGDEDEILNKIRDGIERALRG